MSRLLLVEYRKVFSSLASRRTRAFAIGNFAQVRKFGWNGELPEMLRKFFCLGQD
jgi:hypothetical protein